MKDRRISIRLNMEKHSHRKVYEIYQAIPPRERSDYIRLAIILMNDRDELIKRIKDMLAPDETSIQLKQPVDETISKEDASEAAVNMLNFISNLNEQK